MAKGIMTLEPSKELSKMLGFPHYISREVDIEDLHLTGEERAELEKGKTIKKRIKYDHNRS